jgi:hypothetical protein
MPETFPSSGGRPVGASGPIAGGEPQDGELVDVASVPLAELVSAQGDSPVLRSIRRLQANLKDDRTAVLSAFSSFIDES